ncbi:hypothetical protein [Anabaena lutea]|uniref:hypothetical protein n=1 Tax=Anabaena lutea TaxID=212350 RepID=UPI001F552065|nr:hypothetical protein [Anabaena lutea]
MIIVFKASLIGILSLLTCVMVQEILYGKEMMPLSRDRILDSLISLVLAHITK